MTEAEWLAVTCEVVTMLDFVRPVASDRKSRLFACAAAAGQMRVCGRKRADFPGTDWPFDRPSRWRLRKMTSEGWGPDGPAGRV